MTDERNAEALAAAQLRTEQSDESPRMGFTEWNLQATMLAQLIDAVHSLNQTVVAVGGGKPHQPKPFPRPESIGKQALQEIREKSAASFLDEITADHNQNKY
ncbi:MAG: hypothetical protein MSC45_00080 [Mobiluncus sp.]|uniref:hypothetical protein n=1 Tax=Mobiluncus sp. TaxID=47293 RepID=UPI002583C21F|nr:hypothetical protein [Mobiluncus sp.]MCI6583452.1 hypothetical protein [Mobiluncus sp.]